ncbi:uncharacterized protein PAC_05831 [Phialocephala subalpina]|uniref:Glycoside hydrolase subgroup catalytic core n=1 Tax=Phialocephala subalpina TaxID=576137 RepID=A0A1L7WT78_9HELO|nr:uncharacterized protein PAC_05831 [Phialocephala subalpina]
MAIMFRLTWTISLLVGLALAISDELAAEFGYPAGVDVWCGKAYRSTNGSFEPGGWLEAPALSSTPLLDLSIRPRTNLYLASEKFASFVIDAPISYMHGSAYTNASFNKQTNITSAFTKLFIDVSVVESGLDLISSSNVTVNTTNNEFGFSLSGLTPRIEPYEIVITGASGDGAQFYTATTELYYIPERTDGGSVVKVDNLYGGLLVQDYLKNSTAFTPLFPYTYYTSWDGWLELSTDNIQVFKDKGYNIIHIVPNAGLANEAFDFDELDKFLDIMDDIELWLMFDMRWTYKNLSSVETQVNRIKSRKSMLLWYTGDEPDGQVDALNSTKITYDLIKSLDPYHPISLCLNCYNYYFANYTSGADIIMSDPYPIAVNTSFSVQYDTVCNTTYGCCGCDDCSGDFEDVSERLDLYKSYQAYLGLPQKPQWGVPQAFGNETFWARYPTEDEEIVMNMLFVNHGAKGIAMWDYPTEPGIANITGELSKVLTSTLISSFLLGSFEEALEIKGLQRVDAAAWTMGSSMLVSVVNKNYVDTAANVSISLPGAANAVSQVVWGSGWTINGSTLIKAGIKALEVDIFIIS